MSIYSVPVRCPLSKPVDYLSLGHCMWSITDFEENLWKTSKGKKKKRIRFPGVLEFNGILGVICSWAYLSEFISFHRICAFHCLWAILQLCKWHTIDSDASSASLEHCNFVKVNVPSAPADGRCQFRLHWQRYSSAPDCLYTYLFFKVSFELEVY